MPSVKSQKQFDVFLSHNSRDKPLVEKIANWLVHSAGLNVWLDKWNLIPGDQWQEDLEEALNQSESCAIFVGTNQIGSWQNEEMRSALDEAVSKKSIRVVPVLLPGALQAEKESELPRFLRRLTWVKFEYDVEHEPEALRRLVCGIKGIAPGHDAIEPDPNTRICPFRGLEIFRQEDSAFFFGRESIVQRVKDHVEKYHFLALIGPSGSGKSSIVQAGLLPALVAPNLLIANLVPRLYPLDELANAIHRINGQTAESLVRRLRDSEEALYFLTRELIGTDKRLLLVIDQFEELFTQTTNEADRKHFIALLLKIREKQADRVSIVLTMRSDFIGRCANYPDLNTFVNDHFIQVGSMSEPELRMAISEPARLVGLQFEPGLVEKILSDTHGAFSELPLIEYALLELWKRRKGIYLTHDAYQSIGGVEGALVNRAEEEYAALDVTQQEVLRRMFVLRLVQPGEGTEDTRRRATRAELVATGESDEAAEALVNRWLEIRMLTSYHDRERNQDYVDVAHEALIRRWDRLKEWMDTNRESARLIGQLRQSAIEWESTGRNLDYLFQGSRLLQMEELVQHYAEDLTVMEEEFVQEAVHRREAIRQQEEARQTKELEAAQNLAQARKRQLRNARILVAVSVIAVTIVSFLGYRAYRSTIESQNQLARNYWQSSNQEVEKGNLSGALQYATEAFASSRDQNLTNTLALHLQEMQPQFQLVEVLQGQQAIRGAVIDTKGDHVLAWGGSGETMRLWDITTNQSIGQPMKHGSRVRGATFDEEEKHIISWDDDTVRLWNAKTGQLIGKPLNHRSAKGGTLTKENNIISWGNDTIRLWNNKTGQIIGQPVQYDLFVSGEMVDTVSRRIISLEDSTVRLWSVDNSQLIDQSLQHSSLSANMVSGRAGKCIISLGQDKTLRMWTTKTSKPVATLMKHKQQIYGALFDKARQRVLSFGEDKTVRLWDVRTGLPIIPPLQHGASIMGAVFSKDERRILSWGYGIVQVWDATTGQPIGQPIRHNGFVNQAMFDQEQKRIISWGSIVDGSDGILRVWETRTVRPAVSSIIDREQVQFFDKDGTVQIVNTTTGKPLGPRIKLDRHGNNIVVGKAGLRMVSWEENIMRLWNVKTGDTIGLPMMHDGLNASDVTFDKAEKRVLSRGDSASYLWDANTGHLLARMKHNSSVDGVRFDKEERHIISWGKDSTIRLWDARTGKPDGKLMTHTSDIDDVMFDKEDRRILSRNDSLITIWDAQTGRSIGQPIHYKRLHGMMFDRGEKRILTFSASDSISTLQLWSAETGRALGPPMKSINLVNTAIFDKDDRRILTMGGNGAGKDGTLQLWSAETGKQLCPPMRHGDAVNALFDEEGQRILSWSENGYDNDGSGAVRLWNAGTGQSIGLLMKHNEGVKRAVFLDKGRYILSDDGQLHLWDAVTGQAIGLPKESAAWATDDPNPHVSFLEADDDLPKDLARLQVNVTTGTQLNTVTGEIEYLSPDVWKKLKADYEEKAQEHYKHCQHPHANFWRRFNGAEARKLRPEVR